MKSVLLLMLTVCMSGCTHFVTKSKDISVEYDATGKQVRKIETESVESVISSKQNIKFKHLDF